MALKYTIFIFIFFSSYLTLKSQVTIGSGIAPPEGVALNIQTKADSDPDNGGETSKLGILFPRVKLDTVNSLSPIITGDVSDIVKNRYKGLQVYDISTKVGGPGIKTWDGDKWLNNVTTILNKEETTSDMLHLIKDYDCGNFFSSEMKPMPFGDKQSDGTYGIKIKSDGSYIFGLRLYGNIDGVRCAAGTLELYLYLIVDGKEIDAFKYPVNIMATSSKYDSSTFGTVYDHNFSINLNMAAKNIKEGSIVTLAINTRGIYYPEYQPKDPVIHGLLFLRNSGKTKFTCTFYGGDKNLTELRARSALVISHTIEF